MAQHPYVRVGRLQSWLEFRLGDDIIDQLMESAQAAVDDDRGNEWITEFRDSEGYVWSLEMGVHADYPWVWLLDLDSWQGPPELSAEISFGRPL